MDTDARRHYRVTPADQHTVEVSVSTADGQAFPAELLDITIEGAGTRFLREAGPTLAVGQAATLTFKSARLRRPIRVQAKVRSRVELGAFRSYRYGFEFDGREELEQQLGGEIYRLFNQRNIYRVEPDPEQPIEAVIHLSEYDSATPASAAGFEAHGHLKDLSTVGAAVLVDRRAESTLAATDLVELSFRLPGSGRALRLTAWIRHRELQDEHVCYGLEFDPMRSEAFARDEHELLKYARRRQLAEAPKRPR